MKLKQDLIKLAQSYGQINCGNSYAHPNEPITSSLIFNDIKYSFQEKSWKAINENPLYLKRTYKKHPRVKTKKSGIFEMQSSNSSDALAMNIFCYPDFSKIEEVRKLFKVSAFETIKFGYKAKVNKTVNNTDKKDSTDVDVFLNGNIFIECKLTEGDFTYKENNVVEQYTNFESVFDIGKLQKNKTQTKYKNYQLIRNILAAKQYDGRFILICDMRRPDLAKNFFQTVSCIKNIELRTKCEIIYWQDIAKVVGSELQSFLKFKYGIS